MSAFGIIAMTFSFCSLLGSAVYVVKVAPSAWKEMKTDKRYAAEMMYGAALVGAITGFQLLLTAPLLIPHEIAFQTGYIERTFNIAMVNYVARGEETSYGMDYATKLNPVENKED